MVRWQCELRVSLRTRWFSLLIYAMLACLILLAPWPMGGAVVCLLLLTLITFEYFQSQRKYRPTVITLDTNNVLQWNQQQWNIIQPPWITRYGVLLALKQQANNKIYQRLWLASDSMTEREWRMLCQLMRGLVDLE